MRKTGSGNLKKVLPFEKWREMSIMATESGCPPGSGLERETGRVLALFFAGIMKDLGRILAIDPLGSEIGFIQSWNKLAKGDESGLADIVAMFKTALFLPENPATVESFSRVTKAFDTGCIP